MNVGSVIARSGVTERFSTPRGFSQRLCATAPDGNRVEQS
jgi:hypothetical protein